MSHVFDMLGVIYPRRKTWRIKVRVISLWTVKSVFRANQINSLEMVLIDEKGDKIQASIRRQLIYMFLSKIVEGNVYKMSHFIVVPTDDRYRTNIYPYKLIFRLKTKVRYCPNDAIDRYGFNATNITQIYSLGAYHRYLIDVIGVVTGITNEREYIRNGKMTRMIIIELSDHSGKVECILYGEYVGLFQELIAENSGKLHVIVIQFGVVKLFRDKVSIQNVDSATRIYFDPPVKDVVDFKNSLYLQGVNCGLNIPLIDPPSRILLEDEFLVKYPKKTISQLVAGIDDGIYVVSGVVTSILGGDEWWYPSCTCHKIVSREPQGYYCEACVKYFLHMVPRYKVNVIVDDGTGQAVFILFDLDMCNLIDKKCSELFLDDKVDDDGSYPVEFDLLVGLKLLFQVEKGLTSNVQIDGSFNVKRVCDHEIIIAKFDDGRFDNLSGRSCILKLYGSRLRNRTLWVLIVF
ncbi:replication protein A 70 kDa DNA-binding subunit B [Trifolium repens]|nr:replication protein A 70 kDa DNA-binding subunit B [Trifolium repens]